MCQANNHIVGSIAMKLYSQSEWTAAIDRFALIVDDFNVRGQRDEIPHPGFIDTFNFCPECGAALAGIHLRTFGEALTDVETARQAKQSD